ncbi:MAG: glycosyltransferase [Muribaculaceae bacterium]|nr:glycosyltransferase [Muribaculaceae bacterium]
MVKLSIIVPVFNCEKFLEKCVNSILSQTIKDFELILVNDGSIDNSLEICNNFAMTDFRIKVFTQDNFGQSKARNVGLENATGEFVTFVDADDWVDSDYYQKLIDASSCHDADIACGSILRVRKAYTKIRIKYDAENVYTNSQEKIDAARVPDMCYVWNKVYRRSLLDKLQLRFVEGMYFEDVDFVTRAVYFSNKIVTVPGTYYNYWTNGNSTVKTLLTSDKKCADSLRSKSMVLEFFKEHNLKSKPKNLIRKKTVIKLGPIPILKVYEWEARKKYYLFGFIPVFEVISYA